MLLDPGRPPALLRAATGEQLHDLAGDLGRLAGGEDAVDGPGDRLGRDQAEHGDMVDLRQLEPERGQVHVAPAVEELLRSLVGSTGRCLTGEARRAQIRRLLFARWLAFRPSPAWWTFAQRRR